MFEGNRYRCVDNWVGLVPEPTTPINYLEIGVFYGSNIISFAQSDYAKPGAQIHGIDPWIDYSQYDEYKGQQMTIYDTFKKNVTEAKLDDVIQVHRGFSRDIIPTFKDDYFDIIYIDGNHEPQYIVEDAVLSFRKLKVHGYLIFDDYGWRDASIGIDSFLNAYSKSCKIIHPNYNTQVFIQRIV